MHPHNRKMRVSDGKSGSKLRVWSTAEKGLKYPSVLVMCGDCDEKVRIYYGADGMEINGVNGSWKEWLAILSDMKKARGK